MTLFTAGLFVYWFPNKYNPRYNLQPMLWHAEIAIVAAKGNMANKEIQNENKSTPSNETCGTLFEIRVMGYLDQSCSERLEGPNVKF